jgi:hypothetical protein
MKGNAGPALGNKWRWTKIESCNVNSNFWKSEGGEAYSSKKIPELFETSSDLRDEIRLLLLNHIRVSKASVMFIVQYRYPVPYLRSPLQGF